METEIGKLKRDLQSLCPHTEYDIEDCDYIDEKMSSPVEWQEKVCKRCGKVLSTSEEQTKTVWRKTN
jgi:hypothetical protein